MVILIFCIVAAIITLCIIFRKEDCLDAGGFCAAIMLGFMIGGFAGLIGGCISSAITDNNLDYYSLESRSNYELIKQTVDDKTYYVKETTKIIFTINLNMQYQITPRELQQKMIL